MRKGIKISNLCFEMKDETMIDGACNFPGRYSCFHGSSIFEMSPDRSIAANAVEESPDNVERRTISLMGSVFVCG